MGERTARVGAEALPEAPDTNGGPAPTREATRQLEGDISALRDELGTLVAELDHRRHELVDVKLQLKRHAGSAALFGLALVLTAGGFVWLGIWRSRLRERPLSKAYRLREAVSRMVDRPDRVATEPTVLARIVAGAATAAAATLVKKGIEQLARVVLDAPPAPSPARPHPVPVAPPGERRTRVALAAASDTHASGTAA
jgi:hypothetical protein